MTENTEFDAVEFNDPEDETPTDETNVVTVAALAALAGAGATAAICWFRRNQASLKEKLDARKAKNDGTTETASLKKKD